MASKPMSNANGNAFSFQITMAITLSILIAVSIAGFAAAVRYYIYRKRRKSDLNSTSYSILQYWQHKMPTMSFDSLNPSPPMSDKDIHNQTHHEVNEMSRILKNSFSWPEATLLHQHKQQPYDKDECTSTISSSSLSNSSTMEHIAQPASLTFALRWDTTKGSLFVRIINARNLFVHRRSNPQSALIDSYVRIELTSTENENNQEAFQSMRTHIIKKNAHPIYDELFEFTNIHELSNCKKLSLLFSISTYDTFTRDEILGQVMFPIILPDDITPDTLQPYETTYTQDITPRHKQLCNQQLGQMLISLCYQPVDSMMTLIVLKASNLPRIGTTRLLNPYFKIYMFYKGQRIIKKRSSIKQSTQCPVYNECFTFHIPNNDLQNIHFDIILFDYDRHMKNEPIGTFSIGSNTSEVNQHWNDVCHRQITKQIAQWYQLKPYNILNY